MELLGPDRFGSLTFGTLPVALRSSLSSFPSAPARHKTCTPSSKSWLISLKRGSDIPLITKCVIPACPTELTSISPQNFKPLILPTSDILLTFYAKQWLLRIGYTHVHQCCLSQTVRSACCAFPHSINLCCRVMGKQGSGATPGSSLVLHEVHHRCFLWCW